MATLLIILGLLVCIMSSAVAASEISAEEANFRQYKETLEKFNLRHIDHQCNYEVPHFNSSDDIHVKLRGDFRKVRLTRYSTYWNIAMWLARKAAEGNPLGGNVLEISGTSALRKYLTKADTTFTVGDYPDVDVTCLDSKYEGNTFDGVILDNVLEHVANPILAMIQVWRVLKKGGFVIIVVPSTYPYHWGPWDFWRYNPDSLKVLVSLFSSIATCGCYRSSKIVHWLSKVYPAINIYPDSNEHASKMARDMPLKKSLTLPDYGKGIDKDNERQSSGDPKYGEFVMSSWMIAIK